MAGDLKDRLAVIDSVVSQIDRAELPMHEMEVTTGTDSGSTLEMYGTAEEPQRVRWNVGLSSSVVRDEFYFSKRILVHVRRTRLSYPILEDGTVLYEEEGLVKDGEAKLYFREGKLIAYFSNGMIAKMYPCKPSGNEELRLAAYFLRHWLDKEVDLELWVGAGQLID